MKPENRNYLFAGAFVDELVRSGLRHVCICPGSRSSPLTISFARNSPVKTWVHLDERSAGFFALGMAKALSEPVALVCTSGTAAANLFPAVVEARYSCTPLLVLTSDRPPELLGWGASQTILQSRMYGVHAKWTLDLPAPEITADLLRYVRATACRAFATAAARPAGPVHINLPFRDPLAPEEVPQDMALGSSEEDPVAWSGRPDGSPFLQASVDPMPTGVGDIEALTSELRGIERGIIVCGPQWAQGFPNAVTCLARVLGYPVLADPLSQVRCGQQHLESVIDNYDIFLRDIELVTHLVPEVVLRFGATPISKPLAQFLERHRSVRHILVKDAGWHDPSHLASEAIDADPTRFCRELTSKIDAKSPSTAWLEEWRSIRCYTKDAVEKSLRDTTELFEGKVFSKLSGLLPEKAVLFAGNSMPIRDMDAFLPTTTKSVWCMANRGASGIDGVVSTALGVSAVADNAVVLVLGDLSLYHDMNGLYAAKRHNLRATIIVLNNDGGGVFSFLPQARYPEVFEEYFGTPHGMNFKAAAQMYGLGYSKVQSWDEFRQSVSRGLSASATTIVEVPGNRAKNVELHRCVWSTASEALRAGVKR